MHRWSLTEVESAEEMSDFKILNMLSIWEICPIFELGLGNKTIVICIANRQVINTIKNWVNKTLNSSTQKNKSASTSLLIISISRLLTTDRASDAKSQEMRK